MKIVNGIYSLFFDLGQAIANNSEDQFKRLINSKSVNTLTKGGYSPLHLSLFCDNIEFSYQLLEHGADANHCFIDEKTGNSISILQDRIKANNLSQAKLLIYYGADIDSLKNIASATRQMLDAATNKYRKIKACCDSNPLNYEELATIWQEISNIELDTKLKQCYQSKAQNYSDLACKKAQYSNLKLKKL